MEKTEFSIQIDTAEQKKMSDEPMKQEEAVSKVHEKLEKQEPLIELRNIYKIYYMGDEEVHANDGISLSINKGEFVAIVGKSGSGKSTLMNIIGALDVPTEGEYFLGGEDVADMSDNELAEIRNRMIGFIFQQYNFSICWQIIPLNVATPLFTVRLVLTSCFVVIYLLLMIWARRCLTPLLNHPYLIVLMRDLYIRNLLLFLLIFLYRNYSRNMKSVFFPVQRVITLL